MKNVKENIMRFVFILAACVSIAAVALICIFLFANGIPAIAKIGPLKFLGGTTWNPNQEIFGIFPMIIGSIYATAIAIIVGVPIGLLTSVFLARFCPEKLYKVLKPAVSLLAGIPSIVYGFFGLVVMVPIMQNLTGVSGKNVLTAGILLGFMILPTIIEVSEAQIRAVPNSYYEGSLALGATHERSVYFAMLPAAKSGIMAGVILGIGRAIGETMAVVMIAGNQAVLPKSLVSGVRTMTANIVLEMGYATDLHREALIATGVVLFVFILVINVCFSLVKKGIDMAAPKVGINQRSFRQKLAEYRHQPLSLFLLIATLLAAVITVFILFSLILYILVKGIPAIRPEMFAWKYTTTNNSMMPSIINTLEMVVLTLILAVPIGVCSAIYLVEYAKRGNKLVKVVRMTTETLQGIPSIVFGLFGYLMFVVACHFGYSLLGGAITLALMVLPLIMRTTEEALMSVPDSFREGSFGLGAGRLRTVFKIIVPSAMPGILSGVILAIGRIVGETAALMYTAGTATSVCASPMGTCRTLAVHMYQLLCEGREMNAAYATAVVLLVMVILINLLSSTIAKKLTKK